MDSSVPSFLPVLSLPQSLLLDNYLQGISSYSLSLPVDAALSSSYSPLGSSSPFHLDADQASIIRWSVELLSEVRRSSVQWSVGEETLEARLSLLGEYQWRTIGESLSPIYSFLESLVEQRWTLAEDSGEAGRVYSLADQREITWNFGADERRGDEDCLFSLSPLVWTLPRGDEKIDLLYSPLHVEEISFEKRFVFVEELSRRAFRRQRCKNLTEKSPPPSEQLDLDGTPLTFNGNEPLARGEEHYATDLPDDEEKEEEEDKVLLVDLPQSLDVVLEKSSLTRPSSPCLTRSEYEREPPPTCPSLRREIGSISFDSSLAQPRYKFDKSFKRFVHFPVERSPCSFDVFHGYAEFLAEYKSLGENYFRSFDSTDLRPLLHWIANHQSLFSSRNASLLSPPQFICRRLVLRTLLANLYCDSEPWKLLVVRLKGQFFMALANRETKCAAQLTEDEYSGYRFESLFTSAQPNSSRLSPSVPLQRPQEQFHTVQYWTFGKYSLLYSNEIDGEIAPSAEKDDLQLPGEEKERTERGYVELKCTKKKIFYREENQLKSLSWWAQMWLAKTDTLMIGYKSPTNPSLVEQIEILSLGQLVGKFLSRFDLRLQYCLSYLYSFLELLERTVLVDDPSTIHAFAYIPQPLQLDPLAGDLPDFVPFRYTQIARSSRRHEQFLPEWFVQRVDSSSSAEEKSLEQLMKKRQGHRGRASCPLKQKRAENKSKAIKRKDGTISSLEHECPKDLSL